jgi:hypothetical protein
MVVASFLEINFIKISIIKLAGIIHIFELLPL